MSEFVPRANACVRHWTTNVEHQDNEGTCFAYATADMIGTIYRMKGVKGFVASPQPILDLGFVSLSDAAPFLKSRQYGLQSTEDYAFAIGRKGVWFEDKGENPFKYEYEEGVWPCIGKTHYVKGRPRYVVGGVQWSTDKNPPEMMLAKNFTKDGPCFPMLGFLIMGDLEDPEVARIAYLHEPFHHPTRPDYQTEVLDKQDDHVVLVVGFNNTQGDPYCVIKNSWGPEWGYGGFSKVGIEVLNGVGSVDVGLEEMKFAGHEETYREQLVKTFD